MSTEFTEYNLKPDAYLAFDATTLKQLLIDKLNESGVFTDQNFEGSNMSAFIDVIAFMYHVLLFQLNRTASESMFSQAELYENVNKIVSLLNYKPTGYQTSLLQFSCSATNALSEGIYTLKRYSYFVVDGQYYSFKNDITINKSSSNLQYLEDFSENEILYQGRVTEYVPQIATGEDFETFSIVIESPFTDSVIIPDNFFSVFVKNLASDKWYEFKEVDSLYTQSAKSRAYERRLNENGHWEIKFGDGVNAQKLNSGDTVGIYYLRSSGKAGQVKANSLLNKPILLYKSSQFEDISNDLYSSSLNLLDANQTAALVFNNDRKSTDIKDIESVEEIQKNSPKIFSMQGRAVTQDDFLYYINKHFSDIIYSANVVNNTKYTNEYLKYFYNLGLDRPNEDTRVMLHQALFSSSCDFNNIYITIVPRFGAVTDETTPQYLSESLKQLIINDLDNIKLATVNLVPIDPVYTAVNVGLNYSGEVLSPTIYEESYIVIKKLPNVRFSSEKIKQNIAEVFSTYFSNSELNQVVDINLLTGNILKLEGISNILTRRITPNGKVYEVPGLSLILWNPLDSYSTIDIRVTQQNVQLPFFKYPFLYKATQFKNRILIENE